jgi:hypothetical protein
MRASTLKALLLAAVLAVPAVAQAAPLAVVNVGFPAINCVFNTSCTIGVTDSSGAIPLGGISGTAVLQSRTFVGGPGYMYRVNLTNAVGIVNIPCITALRVSFGPVVSLQYNAAGPLDQVFVATSGGIGTIGLASADLTGNDVTFTFSSPVCAGGSPGTGDTTFFFGLASTAAPKAITAQAFALGGAGPLFVPARAPNF